MSDQQRTVLSVSDITRRIKAIIEDGVGSVWVEGEVSNLRRPASGHCYFTLKDSGAQIACVMFRGNQRPGLKLCDGMQARVCGEATVYERGGNYQILVRVLEQAGQGELQRKFEELKERLRKEGLFEQSAKKSLPMLPRHVGIVTSRTGAAIHDILNVVERRFRNMHIIIAPVKVQGDGAASEIAEAIALLNRLGGLDVLIVGRGGGSIEDLWAFNEEAVARAIWASKIPVISAVGHEIDFTISDFVADLRAPTPSAAAELLVGRKDEFNDQLSRTSTALTRLLRQSFLEQAARFNKLCGSYVFREPLNILRRHRERLASLTSSLKYESAGAMRECMQRLDESSHRLASAARSRFQEVSSVLDDGSHRMAAAARMGCAMRYGALDKAESSLRAMNPLRVLRRGYSITRGADGKCISSTRDAKRGTRITTLVADGEIDSVIEESRTGSEVKDG